MSQRKRIFIALGVILVLVVLVFGVELLKRQSHRSDLEPGSIPIYIKGELIGSFVPGDLDQLDGASFVDAEEGKTQDGWMLRDVLLLYVPSDALHADTQITVSSSSRDKSITLTWAEVNDIQNMVMFDLSGRGTLKLVSKLPGFDTRDDWVQDVDKIEVGAP